jgi:hypothetical protein
MKKSSPRLQVEEFEGRTLLSGTASPSQLFGPALTAHPVTQLDVHLGGTISGQYTTGQPIPDAGTSYHLTGTGKVGTLGAVWVSGLLTSPGFVIASRATGWLTLANAHGSVTLHLMGPEEQGFGPVPKNFTFTVAHATGAYEHFRARGAIDLKLKPSGGLLDGTFTLTIRETLPPMVTGIRGVVLEGPIWPVDRPGVLNTRPVPGAVISVRRASGGPEILRQKADSEGRFHLALDPGVYVLVALAPWSRWELPHGIPQTIVVTKGHVPDVALRMDTGIV